MNASGASSGDKTPRLPRLSLATALTPRMLQITKLLSRVKCGAEGQQFVELGGIVADTIGPGDEDLPTLFCKEASLCDSHDDAQADRRRGIFSS